MYLGYHEAAEFLGIKLGSLYALVHQQRIPHIRLSSRFVRFEREELVRWMREHAVQPGAPQREASGAPEEERAPARDSTQERSGARRGRKRT